MLAEEAGEDIFTKLIFDNKIFIHTIRRID